MKLTVTVRNSNTSRLCNWVVLPEAVSQRCDIVWKQKSKVLCRQCCASFVSIILFEIVTRHTTVHYSHIHECVCMGLSKNLLKIHTATGPESDLFYWISNPKYSTCIILEVTFTNQLSVSVSLSKLYLAVAAHTTNLAGQLPEAEPTQHSTVAHVHVQHRYVCACN